MKLKELMMAAENAGFELQYGDEIFCKIYLYGPGSTMPDDEFNVSVNPESEVSLRVTEVYKDPKLNPLVKKLRAAIQEFKNRETGNRLP